MAPEPYGERDRRRYLIVQSGGVRCALPVLGVHRVVRGMPVTTIPGGARRLVGLSHHDGDPLVVLDLLELLGLPAGAVAEEPAVTVVAEVGRAARRRVGLAVDAVVEVATLDVEDLSATGAAPLETTVTVGGRTVHVVDLEAVGNEG